MNDKTYPMPCVLCGDTINSVYESHNPQPLADGRCCSTCNMMEVIPERMRLMYGYSDDAEKEKAPE